MTTNEAIIKYLANRAQGNKLIEVVKTIEESGFTATTDSTNGGKRMVFCKATGTRLYYNKSRNDFSVGSVIIPLNKTVSDKCDFENLLNKAREKQVLAKDVWVKFYYKKLELEYHKRDIERCIKNIKDEIECFRRYTARHQQEMLRLGEELTRAQVDLENYRKENGLSPKKKIYAHDIIETRL